MAEPKSVSKRHGWVPVACAVAAVGMVGAAYAAVPFYRAFCQATGFDGTVRRGTAPAADAAIDRTLTVRFDTNVRNLPWSFRPEVVSMPVRLGEPGQAWFKIRNDSDQAITGRALYNVVPESAAAYFVKTECFCFKDQTIPAHTEMRFPVIFYIQPKFASDRNTSAFQEVTLSYTYFPATDAPAATRAPALAQKAPQGLGGTRNAGL